MTKEISLFDIQDKLSFLLNSNQNFKLQLSGVVASNAIKHNVTLHIVSIDDKGMVVESESKQRKTLDQMDMKNIPASELKLMMQTDVEDAIAAITVNAGPISSATDPRLTYQSKFKGDHTSTGWYFIRDKATHEPMIIAYVDGTNGLWYDNSDNLYISTVQNFIQNNNAEIAGPIEWPCEGE
jgi:hypothetical protein